jgi:hypothetical protein
MYVLNRLKRIQLCNLRLVEQEMMLLNLEDQLHVLVCLLLGRTRVQVMQLSRALKFSFISPHRVLFELQGETYGARVNE